jgi:cysteine desulfurase
VKKAIFEALDIYGNPSSLHGYGRLARKYVEEAREKVARFIGAKPEEILFVGSGSEGNNTVLSILNSQCGACEFNACSGKELITTTIEHPCVLEASRCMAE